VVEAPITRTCNLLAVSAAALVLAAPAAASIPSPAADPAKAYVAARAASISGNHVEAAQIYAALAAGSNDKELDQRAISEAISAGQMPLALRLIAQSKQAASVDSKLLLVADALRNGKEADADRILAPGGGPPDLSFWQPLVEAWQAADRRDSTAALSILGRVPRNSAFAAFVDEESALILVKLGKTAEAEPYARRAIGSAGSREYRVRLALAAGFQAAGDKARALAMLDGISGDTSAVRKALESGRLKTVAIDSAARAFSDQLVALALQMRDSDHATSDPLDIMQIARYAAPDSSSAAILLGNVLAEDDRVGDALAALRSVPAGDPLKSEAMDAEARVLTDSKRLDEALALASGAVAASDAQSDDFARLGDVYSAMKRNNEAAAAYAQAVARAPNADSAHVWPLLLLQASSLQSAGRWPEAKKVLDSAIALAPSEPLILNFLGYAELQHGEDMNSAEAMIRKASDLAPNDASITDSLGWALYKRGEVKEAIDVLQKAAVGDPAQAEIQEHLGDALYSAGRKFEARFAWRAALATADDATTARLNAKIAGGLTQASAAP
jgi:tetratricopeptide (TPR) repeat protein